MDPGPTPGWMDMTSCIETRSVCVLIVAVG